MKKILIILGLLMGLFMVAGCAQDTQDQSEIVSSNQLQYLKAHEEEMADFVKLYGMKEIYEVEFDWDNVHIGTFPTVTKRVFGRYIYLSGSYNGQSNTYFSVALWLDSGGRPNIDRMFFLTEPLFETA